MKMHKRSSVVWKTAIMFYRSPGTSMKVVPAEEYHGIHFLTAPALAEAPFQTMEIEINTENKLKVRINRHGKSLMHIQD